MKNDLKLYLKKIDGILKEEKTQYREQTLKEHLLQIKIFQYERLVHLIVTVFVGIISILFLLFGLYLNNIILLILFVGTFLLFIPYIFHYYFLENGVQKLYHQYWLLQKKRTK